MTPQKALRFAPLVRVSSEHKAKRGESLITQRQQLEQAIEFLGGVVPKNKWYAGQEHATPEQERRILDELIEDAQRSRFDAVMVTEPTRWSRDNLKSKQYLKILREKNVRFFCLGTEIDLWQPNILGIQVEIGEFQAIQQSYKSLINRVSRAERGMPACANVPFGRKFDKKSGQWSVDPKAKELAEELATMYLRGGKSFKAISKHFGKVPSWAYKILLDQSGDTWVQHFHGKLTNIHKDVPTRVPPLLPQETIERIRKRAFQKRWQDYGIQKHPYLFSRIIFDAETGYALTGTTYTHNGHSYYRPYRPESNQHKIRADILEKDVIDRLFESWGGSKAFYDILFPRSQKKTLEDLEKKKSGLEHDLNSIERQINNVAASIQKFQGENFEGFLTKVKPQLESLESTKRKLKEQLTAVNDRLTALPSKKEREDLRRYIREQLSQRVQESLVMSGIGFWNLPFEKRKAFVNSLFQGKDEDGRKYGIYVKRKKGGAKPTIEWEAYGAFIWEKGKVNDDKEHFPIKISGVLPLGQGAGHPSR